MPTLKPGPVKVKPSIPKSQNPVENILEVGVATQLPTYTAWSADLSQTFVIVDVGPQDPIYEGQPVPEGLLFRRGKKTGRCLLTMPRNKGTRSLSKRVMKVNDAVTIALQQWQLGYALGYRLGRGVLFGALSKECKAIEQNSRRLDQQFKSKMLSQDPSFPRVKSKTGVTRTGRRRKGPG